MKTDYRTLSDSDLLCHITNCHEQAVQYVGKLTRCEITSVDDLFSELTPARKALAEAAVELYKRVQIKQAERRQVVSSETACNILRPLIGDIEKEEFWAIYLNQSNRVISRRTYWHACRCSANNEGCTTVQCNRHDYSPQSSVWKRETKRGGQPHNGTG